MALYQDFKDLLQCLNAAKAQYLIVGAHAVAFYTEPRFTKDLDIWVNPTPENAKKVHKALRKFGAPVKNLHLSDLTNPKLVYQIGVAPVRVDIIMGVGCVEFAEAWAHRKTMRLGKISAPVLGIKELVKAKEAANRFQDKLDLTKLLKKRRRI